jgi:hypothetical protein
MSTGHPIRAGRTPRAALGLVLGVLVALAAAPADAADLTVAWKANDDEVTAGYDVEVLDLEGELLQTLDAGDATRLVITDLADGTVYRVRVRPYDQWGHRARTPSRDLVTYPAPRVDEVLAAPEPGRRGEAVLRGVNVAPGARLVPVRAGLRAGAVRVLAHDRVTVDVALAPGARPLAPGDLLVVNPVRRAEEYLKVHRELLDVDGSGSADSADAQVVRQAAGRKAGEPGFDPALDLNGDGALDEADAVLIEALLAPSGPAAGRVP